MPSTGNADFFHRNGDCGGIVIRELIQDVPNRLAAGGAPVEPPLPAITPRLGTLGGYSLVSSVTRPYWSGTVPHPKIGTGCSGATP